MKTSKYSIILILILGSLFSCNSYDDPELDQNEFIGNPVFEVSEDKIDLDLNAKTTEISVTTNTVWWTVQSNSNWATVTADTLYGNTNIKVNISENTTTDTRVANLTLKSGTKGGEKTIVVTQKGLPSHVTVSATSINSTGYGGVYEVDITSNATWTVTLNKLVEPTTDWITVTPMTGFGDGKIVITISKNVNVAIDNLKALVSVSVADETKEIAIDQTGNASCDAPNNTTTLYFNEFFPCDDAAAGSTWTLTDPRDNQTYRVRLMADGNIWMIDDLKFSGDAGAQKDSQKLVAIDGFDGNGHADLGNYFPNYYGDATNMRLYSYIPAERGYFYGWQTVIQSAYARNAGGWSTNLVLEPEYQGIAPDGWQVPSIGQFEVLYAKIGFDGFKNDWEAVLGGNMNYGQGAAANWGVNSYGSYWTITQKVRDIGAPASADNNTILVWRVNNGTSDCATAESPRNYGNVVRLLKKKNN
ncbi:BACON domain-containing protein [Dysgonomonas macrotermitis]|uniref:Major paralogous domain-containing protein n=1 Tax=Dysgonomonas macrotermitis TaxID=1346286 RepID=A0A1M4YEZ9_9BACT|nr:BACON domain-containing protein [Dysgonomonas macrotermitis]SHF04183.1 major paralogous domain-containing protein [Dysgonomonas macrotermitis]